MSLKIFNLILIDYLNYFIKRELWAKELFLQHKGKVIQITIKNVELFFIINNEGFLDIQSRTKEIDLLLEIYIRESLLNFLIKIQNILNKRDNHNKILHISGDASLANTILFIIQNLNFNIINEIIDTSDNVYLLFFINCLKTIQIEFNKIIYNFLCNITEFLTEESNVLVSYPRMHMLNNDSIIIIDELKNIENKIKSLNNRIEQIPHH